MGKEVIDSQNMLFKSKLPKRIFKEDEVLRKENELKQDLFKDSTLDLRCSTNHITSPFTAESDGCKEHMKEAENAFVEKSTDEEPMHDMKENSIEVDGFDELLKEDNQASNSILFGSKGEICNNAIEQILSEAEDFSKNFKESKITEQKNEFFILDRNYKNRSLCFGLESEMEDVQFLESIFQDEGKVIERKAKMHLMGCKVGRIGKTRRKIKKSNNKRRATRRKKFNEIKMLKKGLKSKIKILKVQKLKTKNELGVREGDEKDWLPETHHKKYLKHLLFLFKQNMKRRPKQTLDSKNDWKFAWVNFNEYIKTEDSVSYFHQRVLNLPRRYVKKDLFNELGFLKQKKRKKSLNSEEETNVHAMFIRQNHSDQVYLIAYHFNDCINEKGLHIDQIKILTKAEEHKELKVHRGKDINETVFENYDSTLSTNSQNRTQLPTPTLESNDFFDYHYDNVPGNELSTLLSPTQSTEESDKGLMKIESGNQGLESNGFFNGFDEPFKDFVLSSDDKECWRNQPGAFQQCKTGFLSDNGTVTSVQQRGFELEFDDFT